MTEELTNQRVRFGVLKKKNLAPMNDHTWEDIRTWAEVHIQAMGNSPMRTAWGVQKKKNSHVAVGSDSASRPNHPACCAEVQWLWIQLVVALRDRLVVDPADEAVRQA